jgi:PBSX family phage terminase large subunit
MEEAKPLSPKQKQSILQASARINIWEGSVRSGKTIASLFAWLIYVVRYAPEGNLLMAGKTERTLRRNILDVLSEIVPPADYRLNAGIGELSLFGRKIYLVGANDERSESKIRGVSLAGAYCDELTLFPEGFFQMLLSRLSIKGARLFGTTNPDTPAHWLKKNYLDRAELNLNRWHFVIEDNLSLDPDYIRDLKKEYTGLWYKRYILGEWAVAEGSIYPNYEAAVIPASQLPGEYDAYVVGCDYGSTNPFVYLLLGRNQGIWYLIDEHYYDSGKRGEKLNSQHSKDLGVFLKGRVPKYVDVDPSRPEFINQLRADYPAVDIRHAQNAVLAGIQTVASMMFQGSLKISDSCRHTLDEMAGYVWDNKATERGEDAPMKVNDHCCLAQSTIVETIIGKKLIKDVTNTDFVLSEDGRYHQVLYSTCTQKGASIYKVTFSNGSEIIGTKDHPIFVEGSGWIPLGSLRYGQIVLTLNDIAWNQLSTRAKPTEDIPNPVAETTGYISKPMGLKGHQNICIGSFMKTISATFQQDLAFITKTKTHLTILQKIWNFCRLQNIFLFTERTNRNVEGLGNRGTLKKSDHCLQHGIGLRKAENGIGCMESLHIKPEPQKVVYVTSAAKNLIASLVDRTIGFARMRAKVHGVGQAELITKNESVPCADLSFQSINTAKAKRVRHPVRVLSVQGLNVRSDVYNLEVRDTHSFFANGILTHNCDSLRYAAMRISRL